jgi:hypothetical protein
VAVLVGMAVSVIGIGSVYLVRIEGGGLGVQCAVAAGAAILWLAGIAWYSWHYVLPFAPRRDV